MGYVSWIRAIDENSVECPVAVPGYVRLYKSLQILNLIDNILEYEIVHVTYTVGEHTVNVSHLVDESRRFMPVLETLMAQIVQPEPPSN